MKECECGIHEFNFTEQELKEFLQWRKSHLEYLERNERLHVLSGKCKFEEENDLQ